MHNYYEHVVCSVRCDNPPELPSDVVVSGYKDLATVGANYTINCPDNMTITITCNGDGEWEPDMKLMKLCMRTGICNILCVIIILFPQLATVRGIYRVGTMRNS